MLADSRRASIDARLGPEAAISARGRLHALVTGPVLGPFDLETDQTGAWRATAAVLFELDGTAANVLVQLQDVCSGERFAAIAPGAAPACVQRQGRDGAIST